MAYVIHGANETLGGTTVDVTINVGSSSGRKAIAFVSAQEGAFGVTSSIVRDPGGADEAFTLIRDEDLFNSGDAIYLLHAHRLDLTATGSQTFRATVSASSARLYLMILVWDDLATGAPEANEYASFTGGGVSSISDSITTSTDGAVIVSGVVFRVTSGAETAPYWTPDNGQTERVDAAVDGRVTVAMGDLVLATAGAQTIGWTGDSAADVGGQILLAFAPAAGGGGGGTSIAGEIPFSTFALEGEISNIETRINSEIPFSAFTLEGTISNIGVTVNPVAEIDLGTFSTLVTDITAYISGFTEIVFGTFDFDGDIQGEITAVIEGAITLATEVTATAIAGTKSGISATILVGTELALASARITQKIAATVLDAGVTLIGAMSGVIPLSNITELIRNGKNFVTGSIRSIIKTISRRY